MISMMNMILWLMGVLGFFIIGDTIMSIM